MNLIINGESKRLPVSINIKYLVGHYQFDPAKVVIEHNSKIVKRDDWGHIVLKENDKIEAISFVGGG